MMQPVCVAQGPTWREVLQGLLSKHPFEEGREKGGAAPETFNGRIHGRVWGSAVQSVQHTCCMSSSVVCKSVLPMPNLEETHTSGFLLWLVFFKLYTSATIKMTRILTACKVMKTLKGRLEFCKASADHWSFWRSGTRLLSIKVTVTASRDLLWSNRCFGMPRDSLLQITGFT